MGCAKVCLEVGPRLINNMLPIVEWNRKPVVDKTWANFKTHFRTAHKELRATTDLTAQDAGMHYSNMVRDVVAALQETMSAPAEPEVVTMEENHAPSPPPLGLIGKIGPSKLLV